MKTKGRLSTGGGEPGMSMKTKVLSPPKAGMLLKIQVIRRWQVRSAIVNKPAAAGQSAMKT